MRTSDQRIVSVDRTSGLIAAAANFVGVQVQTSRGRDLRLAVRELEFLQRLSQSAAATMDADELVELIIRETTSAIGTDVC